MSPLALKRAAIALGVLLVLWGGFAVFRGSLGEDPAQLPLPRLSASDVDRIAVTSPTDTFTLVHEVATMHWRVNGRPASRAAVQEVFDALGDTAVATELVATSPSSHDRMGVSAARGRRIRFQKGGTVLLDLTVGDPGRDYQSAYVRVENDSAVYVYRGRLVNLLARPLEGWRDREIARVVSDSVAAVEITNPRGRYTLRRTDAGWRVGAAAPDSNEVRRLLEELQAVRGSGFPTAAQEDSIGFRRPGRRLVARSAAGAELLHLVFDSTEAGLWVRHDSGGTIWRMDAWRADRITPPESLLVKRG